MRIAADGGFECCSSEREAAEERAEAVRDWIVSYVNCIGCGACRAAIRHVRQQGTRAEMGPRCRECPAAVGEAIRLCPVNARGVWRCTARRQDG